MQMDAGLDSGPVWLQKSITIEKTWNAGQLQEKLIALSLACLYQTFEKIVTSGASPYPQNAKEATYATKIKKQKPKFFGANLHKRSIVRYVLSILFRGRIVFFEIGVTKFFHRNFVSPCIKLLPALF